MFDEDRDAESVGAETPLEYAERLVLAQANELGKEFSRLEEVIHHRSNELDELVKARNTIQNALMGTEKVRASINDRLEVKEEEEADEAPRTPQRRRTGPRKGV